MLRHHALTTLRTGIRVIHHQAELDNYRTTLGWFIQHFEKFHWRIEQTRKSLEHGNDSGKRLDQMWRILNQAVALLYRFAHETELTVLKITNPAMCHM